MQHRKKWSSRDPGCLIILLDQSGSMSKEFGGTELGEGKKKCDMVAAVLNRVLDEFIRSNT
ncbi:MAG: VWA domain-containing protein, partial [Chloroflexi bacterium]|nr:VWA domain-containing protein [Chloroflexota bacterium]